MTTGIVVVLMGLSLWAVLSGIGHCLWGILELVRQLVRGDL